MPIITDEMRLSIIRNYVSLNLKEAVQYGLQNVEGEDKRILTIVQNEFLGNPVYVNSLVTRIVNRIYESNSLQYKTSKIADMEDLLEKLVNKEMLAKYIATYHTFAYLDLMNMRKAEIEQTGIIR